MTAVASASQRRLIDADTARMLIREGRGRGVKVAIIDSGVEVSHPSLAGLSLSDDLVWTDAREAPRSGDGVDVYGHGTAIASIIHSIASEAEIGSFRVFGSTLESRSDFISAAVNEALRRGYHVLNCSFGCGLESHLPRYKRWIDRAYLSRTHIVAACNNFDYLRAEWPGYFPSVITVNYSIATDPMALFVRRDQLVEFSARGADIEVPWMGGLRKTVTGSSYAVPHVVGMLARLLSCAPYLSPLEAKSLMQLVAQPWSAAVAGENVVE